MRIQTGLCFALLLIGLLAHSAVAAEPAKGASSPAPTEAAAKPAMAQLPAGTYTLDKAHASLIFRVNHLGFSNYTARFTRFDATLQFDPANLASAKLEATVDVSSLQTDYPDPKEHDFNATLQNEQWLDTARFPKITFRSTSIELTGASSGRVHGELSLHGVTHPLTLQTTFNGGYVGHPMDPHARIGFSAHGSLLRSVFGVTYGIPAPGTTMGVSDAVDIIIETEFSGPPLSGAAAQPAATPTP